MNTTMLAAAEEAPIRGNTPDADAALEQLYAVHYVALVRLAVLLLRDEGLAEDVVQDSFVAVHRRWDRVDPDKAPAYLRQTVVNRSRSALRRRTVAARHRPEPMPHALPADDSLLRTERRTTVLEALAALPARQREVLALRYYLDLSEADIAATLGISRGAVKSHAARGADALRRTLSREDNS